MQSFQKKFDHFRSNKLFELFVVTIIVISALMVGVKTYEMSSTATAVLTWVDLIITMIFVFELSVRFLGEEVKRNFFKSGWNVFDTLVVAISLIPIEGSEMAVIGRLIRIFRVLRMISFIPELRILINSLFKALPQLGYVVLLMFIIFYIYAALGSTIFGAINPVLWGDIAISMLTLFRVMTFEDWTDVMYETMEVYSMSWLYFLSFIFLTTFAFLNMVIGIIVGVMDEEHAQAREEKDALEGKVTLEDLQEDIKQLKALLKK
ncbi:MAG: ion transporter [Gammaproteobacteria bacterium]|nr:MAG: ion transporter [Gammaproteobacteria bacterium]